MWVWVGCRRCDSEIRRCRARSFARSRAFEGLVASLEVVLGWVRVVRVVEVGVEAKKVGGLDDWYWGISIRTGWL